MKTIEIDDDIYDHLLRNASIIGESASDILRRILGLKAINMEVGNDVDLDKKSKELQKFINSPGYTSKRTAKDKYLLTLFKLHEISPELFKIVNDIRGNQRQYFSMDPKEIEKSGNSTFPQRIPYTNYWALTNLSTEKKRDILKTILEIYRIDSIVISRTLHSIK